MIFLGMDWYDPSWYATEILDTKYAKVLVDDVINQLDHPNAQQKSEHTKLFDRVHLRAICFDNI